MTQDTAAEIEISKQKRPGSVTLLALGVLTIAGFNLVRFIQGLGQWQYLASVLTIPPVYIVMSGLFWALLGLVLAAGLWTGARWAPKFTRLAVLAYIIYFWFDRLLLTDLEGRGVNDVFLAGVCVVLCGWMIWVLSRHKVNIFFGANHEQQK